MTYENEWYIGSICLRAELQVPAEKTLLYPKILPSCHVLLLSCIVIDHPNSPDAAASHLEHGSLSPTGTECVE